MTLVAMPENEFHQDGKMMLSLGGAQNLESPGSYSDAAGSLMEDIGIDAEFIETMAKLTSDNFYLVGNFQTKSSISMPGPNGRSPWAAIGTLFYWRPKVMPKPCSRCLFLADQKQRLIEFWWRARLLSRSFPG